MIPAHLSRARASFDAKQFAPCLDSLLQAWRQWPNALLADVIEDIGQRVDAELTPSDWDIGKFDSTSLPRLLAWLSTQPAGAAANATLRRLPARALPDPRATGPLLALIDRFANTDSKSFAEAALQRNRDPRAAALGAKCSGLTAAMRVRLAKVTPPAPAEDAESVRLVRALGAASMGEEQRNAERAKLFAQLLERPDDPATVAVAADGLAALEDPIGELINLQLARGEGPVSRREAALLERLREPLTLRFLGPGLSGAQFAGGVPVGISCSFTPRVGTGWRAIRRLSVGHQPDWAAYAPILPNLEVLDCVAFDAVPGLLDASPLPKLEHLSLFRGRSKVLAHSLAQLDRPGALPMLSSAEVEIDEADLPSVLGSRLGRLGELEVTNSRWALKVSGAAPVKLEFTGKGFYRQKANKREVKEARALILVVKTRWPQAQVRMPAALRALVK